MTSRSLKPDQPLLVGHLFVSDNFPNEPVLLIAVWCPYCKTTHVHGWGDYDPLNYVSHREAHCGGSSPFMQSGYFIGIDPKPKRKLECRHTVKLHEEQHASWRQRQERRAHLENKCS